MSSRNLAILLTPNGVAAIAVVRLLGPRTDEFLQRHFSRKIDPGRCVHGLLFDEAPAHVIDDAVVVRLPDRDGADINLHGGLWIVQAMLDLARREGFNVVARRDAPEPSPEALEAADGSTLLEKELFLAIPLARTQLSLEVLLNQRQAWEEVGRRPMSLEQIAIIRDDRALWHLLHPPAVAIVGAPNVGKSTLANQLFGQQRSITADVPGTTRDWVGEIANVDGLAVMLLDTPGQRSTDDTIERQAIEQSRQPIAQAAMVLLVLDVSRPLDRAQRALMSHYPTAMRVANKADQSASWDAAGAGAIPVSALTGDGVAQLRAMISSHFGCADMDTLRPHWWTARQQRIVAQAAGAQASLDEMFT